MINGRLKKKWPKMKNTNSFHLNTKSQILKSLLFSGKARLQSTWERALSYLMPSVITGTM